MLTFVSGKQSARLSARRNSPLVARFAALAAKASPIGRLLLSPKSYAFRGPLGRKPEPTYNNEERGKNGEQKEKYYALNSPHG